MGSRAWIGAGRACEGFSRALLTRTREAGNWALQCVLDFLVEDRCLLCGGPPAHGPHPPEDPRLQALAGHVTIRYLRYLCVENRPVCARCLDAFELSKQPGILARTVVPGILETPSGERFAAGSGDTGDAPGRVGPAAVPLYSAFMTNDAVLSLVHRFKFSRYIELDLLLGTAMAAALRLMAEQTEWLVVAMPMAGGDQRRRGFNPVALLAEPVAAALACEPDAGALVKVRRTSRQSLTPHEARADNVRGVFRAESGRVAGRRVLLLDDLVTSGATAASAAAELLAAGAACVEVLCFARAL